MVDATELQPQSTAQQQPIPPNKTQVLHRTGLALLGLVEGTILSCCHPAALPTLIEGRAARTLGAPGGDGLLVAAAFRRSTVGGMPSQALAGMRARAAVEVQQKLDERRRQLELILNH